MQKNRYPLGEVHNLGIVQIMASTEIGADATVGTNNNSAAGAWVKPGATTGVYRWTSADKIGGKASQCIAVPVFRAGTIVNLQVSIKAKSINASSFLVVDVVLEASGVATDPVAACGVDMILWVKDSGVTP